MAFVCLNVNGLNGTKCISQAALGQPLQSWPPFTSNVVLELWGSRAMDAESQGERLQKHVASRSTSHVEGGMSRWVGAEARGQEVQAPCHSRRIPPAPASAPTLSLLLQPKVGRAWDGKHGRKSSLAFL